MRTDEERRIVGVRFTPFGRVFYFSPGSFELEVGSEVEVETEGKVCRGLVVIAPQQVTVNQVKGELDTVAAVIPAGD